MSQDPAHLLIGDSQRFKEKYQRTLQTHLSNPQSLNSYSYVNNNPLKWTDPEGEILPLIAAVAAAWGVIETGLSAYDVYDTVSIVSNPNASLGDKALSVGGFGLGLVLPGGGYGAGAKGLANKTGEAGKAITKIDSKEIRFTQDSISSAFKNGNTLESTINGLKSGKILPNDIPPIRIFVKDRKMYSLDNRRLHVFQKAGLDIPTVRATPVEIQEEFGKKFHPINNGRSVNIRKNN